MPISVQNMIVLYREYNDDSFAFATAYADSYGIDYSHLVPVPCSGNEILANYATFRLEVENAVLAEIEGEYIPDIQVILVGFGIPGGFYDGPDIVSTTSRLSRVGHTFNKGLSNPLYSRQIFQRFDDVDAQTALIVSRIDAPTLDDAIAIIGNIQLTARQGSANGTLFFDPYAPIEDAQEQDYQNEMFDFETNLLPILNLPEWRTTYWDAVTDVVVPRLSGDSFMWSWKADRAGYSFFLDRTTARIFHYNADHDGAAAVRDPNDKRWPMLALNAGYAATAGSMSDPLPEGFLRPRAFFDALFRGATIGEAFLFGIPNLDWTVTLFGDPLLTTRFPSLAVLLDGYTSGTGFDIMGRNLDNIMGFYLMREQAYIDIFNLIQQSKDTQEMVDLLAPFTVAANDVIAKTPNDLNNLCIAYVAFPPLVTAQSFTQYLQTEGFRISRLLSEISPGIQVPATLQYPSGYWDFQDIIQHPTSEFETYQFQLQLANDENFTDLVNTGVSFTSLDNLTVNADSSQDVSNWLYEKNSNDMEQMPASGVISSYAGRRVMYIPTTKEFFQNRQVYWIRIRQVNEFSEATDWVTYKQVVGT